MTFHPSQTPGTGRVRVVCDTERLRRAVELLRNGPYDVSLVGVTAARRLAMGHESINLGKAMAIVFGFPSWASSPREIRRIVNSLLEETAHQHQDDLARINASFVDSVRNGGYAGPLCSVTVPEDVERLWESGPDAQQVIQADRAKDVLVDYPRDPT